MGSGELEKQALELAAEKAELERERLEFRRSRRIGITAIVSLAAVVISGLQVWVSIEQRSLSEAQTIEQYIPHLLKPESRDLALKWLEKYIDDKTIVEIAFQYKATKTLNRYTESEDENIKNIAQESINTVLMERDSLVKNLFSNNKEKRIEATSEIINNWLSDTGLVISLISYASENFNNPNGIYNTLVVLNSMSQQSLAANAKDLEGFLNQAEKIGPKTKLQVDKVRKKMEFSL